MGAAMGTPGFGEVALESLEERQLRSGRGPQKSGCWEGVRRGGDTRMAKGYVVVGLKRIV